MFVWNVGENNLDNVWVHNLEDFPMKNKIILELVCSWFFQDVTREPQDITGKPFNKKNSHHLFFHYDIYYTWFIYVHNPSCIYFDQSNVNYIFSR